MHPAWQTKTPDNTYLDNSLQGPNTFINVLYISIFLIRSLITPPLLLYDLLGVI